MKLFEKLLKLSADVPRRLKFATDESNTGSYLIEPFMLALGYDTTEPDDVRKELTADVGRGRNKADYVLKQDGVEIILVEIKPVGTNLSDYVSQLDGYFRNKDDIKFGMLSDGIKYNFYSDIDRPNIMDHEPFLTLDLQNLDESLLHVLEQFSRTSFEENNAIQAARSAKDRQRVRRTLKAEFDPLSHRIINVLLELIQPGAVEESRRLELTRLVKEEWQSILGLPIRPPRPNGGDGRQVRKVSADVLEIPVFAEFREHSFVATLVLKRDWAFIRYECFIYDEALMTHSEAAKRAVHSINPASFAHQPAWTFWHFKHPETGEKLPIKRLDRNDPLHLWLFERYKDSPS